MTNALEPLLIASRELNTSPLRFDDGGEYRIEIPSVEGVAAFEAIMAAAKQDGVPVHRISQGSGITLLRDDDIRGYARIGAQHGVEVCLFVGPRAPWDGAASALTADGKHFGWRHMSVASLKAAFDDIIRATELGIRSVLVSDEGLITLVDEARRDGRLPPDLIMKASAVLGIANPLTAKMLADAGVDTLNIPADTSLGDLAAYRAALPQPLDIYIEGPDSLGGFTRYHDLGEIVRLASPVHLKFGLRNAPNLYPSGQHLETAAVNTGIERVRRAAIGREHLSRLAPDSMPSPTGHPHPGVPHDERIPS